MELLIFPNNGKVFTWVKVFGISSENEKAGGSFTAAS